MIFLSLIMAGNNTVRNKRKDLSSSQWNSKMNQQPIGIQLRNSFDLPKIDSENSDSEDLESLVFSGAILITTEKKEDLWTRHE